MDVANLIIQVTSQGLTDARRELRRLRDDAGLSESATDKLKGAIGRLGKYAAVSLAGTAAAAVKVSGDFEAAMNGVSAVSGAVGSDFDRMRELAKKMGAETAFSATEAANGMEYLAMAGLNTEQILKTLPNALNLAAAGNLDLASSADILSNIMTGMGVSADESGRAADVLAATAAAANVDVKMLGESMKYAAPIAKQLGISLEDTAASMGILGNAGIQGSEAGTALRGIYTRLTTHKKAKLWFEELGVSVTDANGNLKGMVTILKDLQKASAGLSATEKLEMYKDTVGTEAMSALGVTMDSITDGSLDRLIEKLENAEGSAKRMADIRMEGFNGAIKSAQSALEAFMIELGDAGLLDLATGAMQGLVTAIRAISEQVPAAAEAITAFFSSAEVVTAMQMASEGLSAAWDNLVSVFQATADIIQPIIGWFREHEKLSEALGLAIGIVAGALVVYNAAVVIGAAVTSAFAGAFLLLTSPVTLTILALTALTAAAIYLYQNWGELIGIANDFADTVVNAVVGAFNDAVAAANAFADGIVNWVVDAFNNTVQAANSWADGVVGSITGGFNNAVSAAANFASGLWSWVKQAFSKGLSLASSGLKSIVDAIARGFMAAVNAIKENLGKGVQVVRNIITSILNVIKNAATNMISLGKDFIGGFITGIKSSIGSVIDAARNMTSSAISIVKRTQRSNSDSKVTMGLGKDFSGGMKTGIKKGAKAVKTEAQKMTESAIKAVKDGIASIEKELALLGTTGRVAEFDYDVSTGKYKGASSSDVNKLRSLLEEADAAKELANANDRVSQSIADLRRQRYLFGNTSASDALRHDILYTDKYNGASAELLKTLQIETYQLEKLEAQAKATQAIRERFAKLQDYQDNAAKDFQGLQKETKEKGMTEFDKLEADYQTKLDIIQKYEDLHTGITEESAQLRKQIEEQYMKAQKELTLDYIQETMGSMVSITKDAFGEQSGIYKAMFAIEKGIAIARSVMAIQTALASATASLPFPANLPVIAAVAAQGASIISNIKSVSMQGFKTGGYTGGYGTSEVAGVVHGQEYVMTAEATKRIGVGNLNAMNSGKSVGGDVNITVNNMSTATVETETDSQGNIIMTIREEVKKGVKQGFTNLAQPNSFESKQMKNNFNLQRSRK